MISQSYSAMISFSVKDGQNYGLCINNISNRHDCEMSVQAVFRPMVAYLKTRNTSPATCSGFCFINRTTDYFMSKDKCLNTTYCLGYCAPGATCDNRQGSHP